MIGSLMGSSGICMTRRPFLVILVTIAGLWMAALPAVAQGPEPRQPIDMMLVIDNSGSMFPQAQTCPGCEWGNDPDFLRITGASLFIARLGFAETNAAQYQIGVISLGRETPQLISPLRPLPEVRNSLARAISAPVPERTTYIVPALVAAYRELKESEQRRPGNVPAIVLLTDGKPYPEQGQSCADIESRVKQHPDVPIFIILLENPAKPVDPGYVRYIACWEEMQRKFTHVRTYRAGSAREIERTYNQIVALLQNTIPTNGVALAPGQTLRIYVSKYVQRLWITVTHERGKPKGNVEIKDPRGQPVQRSDPQVEWFKEPDNPVEVIYIGTARLDQAPRDDIWTVTSDAPVVVFADRGGAYNIQFVQPEVSQTTVTNQYLAVDRQSPSRSLVVRLKLTDKAGNAILDPQPIRGRVIHPDGSSAELRIPTSLRPDSQGLYEVTHDFVSTYPDAARKPGRFMLMFEAGLADESGGTRIPIARADLLVDVGRGAYIAGLDPEPLVCAIGQPADLTVRTGDLDAARPGSVNVRVFGAGREVALTPGASDTFVGSLDEICRTLLADLACGRTIETTLRVRMVSDSVDGAAAPSERALPVQVKAAPCTPTPLPPTPTPAPTPTPTPTPIPNRDDDCLNDLEDKCPDISGWGFLCDRFRGCPPPIWLLIVAGLLLLALLAFLGLCLIPMLLVLTVTPPPSGYVLVCRKGRAEGSPKSIRNAGVAFCRSSSKPTIGSKGHVRVSRLKPVEFRVEQRGKEVVVLDAASGQVKCTLRQVPTQVNTSDMDTVLRFSTDPAQLRC